MLPPHHEPPAPRGHGSPGEPRRLPPCDKAYLRTWQGILDVYHYAISQIQFYGPTNFSSFLDEAIRVSRSSVTQQSQSYNILLVITVRDHQVKGLPLIMLWVVYRMA